MRKRVNSSVEANSNTTSIGSLRTSVNPALSSARVRIETSARRNGSSAPGWRGGKPASVRIGLAAETYHRDLVGRRPDGGGKTCAGLERAANSASRRIEVGHEHQTPAADRGVEAMLVGLQRFDIADAKLQVAEAERRRPLARDCEHPGRLIDRDDTAGRADAALPRLSRARRFRWRDRPRDGPGARRRVRPGDR